MSVQIVLFNAPPSSGKTTACNYLKEVFKEDVRILHFKNKLEEIVSAIYSLSKFELRVLKQEHEKEKPQDRFLGLSYRQVLIKVSEEFIKPMLGQDYFAKSAAREALNVEFESSPEIILFDDLGFPTELQEMQKTFGYDNVHVITIQRDGCSYRGDSRESLLALPAQHIVIENHNSIVQFKEDILISIVPIIQK